MVFKSFPSLILETMNKLQVYKQFFLWIPPGKFLKVFFSRCILIKISREEKQLGSFLFHQIRRLSTTFDGNFSSRWLAVVKRNVLPRTHTLLCKEKHFAFKQTFHSRAVKSRKWGKKMSWRNLWTALDIFAWQKLFIARRKQKKLLRTQFKIIHSCIMQFSSAKNRFSEQEDDSSWFPLLRFHSHKDAKELIFFCQQRLSHNWLNF